MAESQIMTALLAISGAVLGPAAARAQNEHEKA